MMLIYVFARLRGACVGRQYIAEGQSWTEHFWLASFCPHDAQLGLFVPAESL